MQHWPWSSQPELNDNLVCILICTKNKQHVARYRIARDDCENNNGRWELENNKRCRLNTCTDWAQYFPSKQGITDANKLNQNLVFPITPFSCCAGWDYCCPISSALQTHVCRFPFSTELFFFSVQHVGCYQADEHIGEMLRVYHNRMNSTCHVGGGMTVKGGQ